MVAIDQGNKLDFGDDLPSPSGFRAGSRARTVTMIHQHLSAVRPLTTDTFVRLGCLSGNGACEAPHVKQEGAVAHGEKGVDQEWMQLGAKGHRIYVGRQARRMHCQQRLCTLWLEGVLYIYIMRKCV